jgi:hypothetical protein
MLLCWSAPILTWPVGLWLRADYWLMENGMNPMDGTIRHFSALRKQPGVTLYVLRPFAAWDLLTGMKRDLRKLAPCGSAQQN